MPPTAATSAAVIVQSVGRDGDRNPVLSFRNGRGQ